ncbi:MAG: hypothetical protein RL511_1525 [Bacteroidota bacterium]|jgi:hypothetical protein
MKKLLINLALLALGQQAFAQTIAQARNLGIGQTVTVSGVVTNGSELGSIRYIQDGTAGIACYGTNLSSVQKGDSITATGVLFEFSGLLELSPTNSYINHGQAVNPPAALSIPIPSAGENLEGQLVRLDNVTFVQTGSFATGNSTVQVTDGSNTFDVRINGTTNIDGSAIPSGPITIIGLLGQFNTNYQLIPRSTQDIFAYVAPAREINVKINGNSVLSGDTYVVGTSATTTITIENYGVQNLTVSGATFSGANAADYTCNATVVVGGTSSQNVTLNFNPGGTGSRLATIAIANDDTDENPYLINLYGIGTNNLATEPTTNPSSITFPTIKPYSLAGEYTAVSAEKYLVLWRQGSPITGLPIDGATYKRGDVVGNAKVAYIGAGTSFTPRHVEANTTYYFAVYAFNGPEGFQNYRTMNAATGSVTTTGSQIGNYYNGINSGSTSFLSDLSALINPHTSITYYSYLSTMMNQYEVRDTSNGQSYVECVYSGERKVFNDPFTWTAVGYSREHSFCHSWMPTYPCDNPEKPEYNDQHNLWPTNLQQANTPRSNLPLMDIDGNVVFTYLEGRVGYSGNQLVYEPRPEQKGNAARSIFYMATCYNGQSANNWQLPANQSQESLKTWHFNDAPDNYEIARHEYVAVLQGNRNPFIDSAYFACHINFANMSYLACDMGLQEKLNQNFSVFPVPASQTLYAQVNGLDILAYQIHDIQGRQVNAAANLNAPVLALPISTFKAGVYFITVETQYGQVKREFVIE